MTAPKQQETLQKTKQAFSQHVPIEVIPVRQSLATLFQQVQIQAPLMRQIAISFFSLCNKNMFIINTLSLSVMHRIFCFHLLEMQVDFILLVNCVLFLSQY